MTTEQVYIKYICSICKNKQSDICCIRRRYDNTMCCNSYVTTLVKKRLEHKA